MQYQTAELYICQVATAYKTMQLDASGHAELISSGLGATKLLLEYYLAMPVYADMALNNSEWLQISFAITVGAKLVITTHEAVNDPQAIVMPQSLDLSGILNQLAQRVGALVTTQVDAKGGRDIFHYYEQRLRRMQAWYESQHVLATCQSVEMAPQSQHQPQHLTTQSMEQQPQLTLNPAPPAMMMPFTIHDSLDMLSPYPSMAEIPRSALNGTMFPTSMAPLAGSTPEEAAQYLQALSADPSVPRTNASDLKMDLFPEMDYVYSDWVPSAIET